ncbi:ABC transporter ATP-binding protein [Streptomyces sp. MRC013]|uniref:ABC transporter ATP-binding protein n=1 Tax=Streptomyces sp. MRC013 TaxID=2898276 RepID=UPI0032EA5747
MRLQDVSHTVADRVLFDGLSLHVMAGESVAVMGPSGSGKTTLLSVLLGLIKPRNGLVEVAGMDLSSMGTSARARHRASHVGMVFQFGELLPELTAMENVMLAAMLAGRKRRRSQNGARQLLDDLGIKHPDEPVGTMSGGERQRVAIARAVVNRPSLVLADEPTGALDAANRDHVAELLHALPGQWGCGVVVVTHDESVARRADRVLTFSRGRLWGNAVMARPLTRQLLAIGMAASRAGEGHRLRVAALLLATVVWCLAVGAGAIAYVTGQTSDERALARGPRFTAVHPAERQTAWWKERGDTVGGIQHRVVFVEPLAPTAEVPPGLKAWPAPGQAVLSPALAEAGEAVTSRYGEDAGRISPAGLVWPGERLAYVRPAPSRGEWAEEDRISGFGGAYRFDDDWVVDPGGFAVVVAAFVGLPAAVLVAAAARAGSEKRDARSRVVHALGGTRRHMMLLAVGETVGPVAIGTVLVSALLVLASTADMTVPVTGWTVESSMVRSRLGVILTVVWLAAVLVAVSAAAVSRRSDGRSVRAPVARKPRRRGPVLCTVGIVMAVPMEVGPLAPNYRTSLLQYAAGIGLALWFLPSVVAWITTRWGRWLADGARLRAGRLVAGRWLAAYPGVVVRLVAAVVVGVGLVSQVQLWSSRGSNDTARAQAVYDELGSSVLMVSARTGAVDGLDEFSADLGSSRGVFSLGADPAENVVLTGSCRAWTLVSQRCPIGKERWNASTSDARLAAVAKWGAGHQSLVMASGRPAAHDEVLRLVVVSSMTDRDAAGDIKRAAYRHLGMAPYSTVIAGSHVDGALRYGVITQWTLVLGAVGVVVLALAAAVAALDAFAVVAGRMVPISVLSGEKSVFRTTAWWYLSVPFGLAGVLAVAVASVLGYPMVAKGGAVWSGGFTWGVAVGTLALGAVVGAVGARLVAARARAGLPSGD